MYCTDIYKTTRGANKRWVAGVSRTLRVLVNEEHGGIESPMTYIAAIRLYIQSRRRGQGGKRDATTPRTAA